MEIKGIDIFKILFIAIFFAISFHCMLATSFSISSDCFVLLFFNEWYKFQSLYFFS